MLIKGNKGEWSEFYTLIKLLSDGKIYAADKELNKNESLFYLILKIIRGESKQINYVRKSTVLIEDDKGQIVSQLSLKELSEYSEYLYNGIKEGSLKESVFQKRAEMFFNKMKTNTLSDERSQTADIRIVIHDPITQFEPQLGFSIKSYIGSKPTLFNASKQTNFIYKITPTLSYNQQIELNKLNTYSDRLNWLVNNGFKISYLGLDSEVFQSNLELIDSKLPNIFGEILLINYLKKKNKLTDLIEAINQINPCSYRLDLNPGFYEYKIKRFLVDAALGMKASKLWTGNFNADGGYIAVKKDGELLCFHIYNWNDFQEYLFTHTKIDHPDSKPSRCDYGRIILEDINSKEESFIKLNFQIRFI